MRISNVCVTNRPTDQPTDGHDPLYKCEDALKNTLKTHLERFKDPTQTLVVGFGTFSGHLILVVDEVETVAEIVLILGIGRRFFDGWVSTGAGGRGIGSSGGVETRLIVIQAEK